MGYKELYQHKCLSRQREKICTEFLQLQETNTVCVCGTMIFVKDLSDDAVALLHIFLLLLSFLLNLFFYFKYFFRSVDKVFGSGRLNSYSSLEKLGRKRFAA